MKTPMVITNEQILIVDTVTKLGPEAAGNVVIAGSHGGVYAGFEAARAGVRGVILHDAGVGLDDAGIGSLSYLEDLGIAAAAIDSATAIIGNGDSPVSRRWIALWRCALHLAAPAMSRYTRKRVF